jgi:hypothetical protein
MGSSADTSRAASPGPPPNLPAQTDSRAARSEFKCAISFFRTDPRALLAVVVASESGRRKRQITDASERTVARRPHPQSDHHAAIRPPRDAIDVHMETFVDFATRWRQPFSKDGRAAGFKDKGRTTQSLATGTTRDEREGLLDEDPFALHALVASRFAAQSREPATAGCGGRREWLRARR